MKFKSFIGKQVMNQSSVFVFTREVMTVDDKDEFLIKALKSASDVEAVTGKDKDEDKK